MVECLREDALCSDVMAWAWGQVDLLLGHFDVCSQMDVIKALWFHCFVILLVGAWSRSLLSFLDFCMQ